jgi:hypothetical protein
MASQKAAQRLGVMADRKRLGGGSGITTPVVAQAQRPLTFSRAAELKSSPPWNMIPGQELPWFPLLTPRIIAAYSLAQSTALPF